MFVFKRDREREKVREREIKRVTNKNALIHKQGGIELKIIRI